MRLNSVFFCFITIFYSTLLTIHNVYADDEKNLIRLNLSVTESIEIEEDMLVAHMQYEYEGQLAKEVQNSINKKMIQVMNMASELKEVKISTERYNIYKYYPNKRRNDTDKDKYVWRGNQTIIMKSLDSDKLLKLAGDLQDIGLLMNGLNFVVSPGKYEEAKDSLLESAILKLKAKADRAAKALGKSKFEFISINIDNNHHYPKLIGRNYSVSAFSDTESMNSPVASPGQSRVNLTVYAEIGIKN